MTHAGTPTDTDDDGLVQCWCCDAREVDERMVRLSNHPEVAVCLGCAHWAGKRAAGIEDADRTGAAVAARNGLRAARRTVVERGWHRLPVVGAVLRRIGRHTP